MNGITPYVTIRVWLLSLSVVFSRFVCVVAWVSTSFLFIAD